MLKIWSMRDKEQQGGAKKPKVKAAALRIQKDLSDLDMSQYPTMQLIFSETPGKPKTPGTPGLMQSPGLPMKTPPATVPITPGTPGTPGTPAISGNAVTPGTPGIPGALGSPGIPGALGTPGTPGTPDTPTTGVNSPIFTPKTTPGTPATSGGTPRTSGRSGSGGTKDENGFPFGPVPEMSKEEEEKKLHFKLEIKPDDGYYVGGLFKFRFDIPDTYPHDPPKVKCEQKIYHPNIDLEGNICLNILREDWKPVLNLNSVLVGLQYLFLEPNPDDPLNKEAAEVQKKDKEKFIRYISTSMSGRPIEGQEYDNVRVP